jgi:hypothetical protein
MWGGRKLPPTPLQGTVMVLLVGAVFAAPPMGWPSLYIDPFVIPDVSKNPRSSVGKGLATVA